MKRSSRDRLRCFYERLKRKLENQRDAAELQAKVAIEVGQVMPSMRDNLELLGAMGLTLDELGKRFGVSRERIRSIEQKALGRLRRPRLMRELREQAEDV